MLERSESSFKAGRTFYSDLDHERSLSEDDGRRIEKADGYVPYQEKRCILDC